MSNLRRENRRHKKYLKDLVGAVRLFLGELDVEMRKPSTVERGRRIAELSNALEFGNDEAWHFGLGKPLRKKKK